MSQSSTNVGSESGEKFRRAVIIGGSMAGSLTAAAVAPHFEEVLVLDRDEFPQTPQQRNGVPQGAHFHALLAAGRNAMDELLPEFSTLAVKMGAAELDSTADVMRLDRAGWSPRFSSPLTFIMASRPLLEWVVRDRASAIESVSFRPRHEVAGLLSENGAVTGVRLADGTQLAADLVVDASGRRSVAPGWLDELGYPRPVETLVNAHWGYASTFVRVPQDWDPGFRALACVPYGEGALTTAAERRAMAMWVVEGERRWILTVQGSAGDYPPRKEADLKEFVGSIGVPELDQALSEIEYPERILIWRDTTNRMRDYAGSAERPENFFTIGDAWTAFNPVYGQGMTVAALSARALSHEIAAHLRERPGTLRGLADRFYDRTSELVTFCWNSSTALDYRIPGVEVTVDGRPQDQSESAGSLEFSDRLAVWASLDKDRYVKYRETTQLLRSNDWLRSDDVVDEIKDRWEELGALLTPR
ncbi:FAD-dependent oxidoreductase [Prauserella cavernicola]|uniref:Tryptophan 7-halogenase n=1 Tax=Prauserella cavernicola TaxID=2800127 RepID=A0A934V7V9_9PSEU|nr:tryptophan 7-halogenase [Prauserella cavernicola]MBK1787123.1 tryptophan 7-halogenase [Prauserella cavernicola]